jgi:hypothetical protein
VLLVAAGSFLEVGGSLEGFGAWAKLSVAARMAVLRIPTVRVNSLLFIVGSPFQESLNNKRSDD